MARLLIVVLDSWTNRTTGKCCPGPARIQERGGGFLPSQKKSRRECLKKEIFKIESRVPEWEGNRKPRNLQKTIHYVWPDWAWIDSKGGIWNDPPMTQRGGLLDPKGGSGSDRKTAPIRKEQKKEQDIRELLMVGLNKKKGRGAAYYAMVRRLWALNVPTEEINAVCSLWSFIIEGKPHHSTPIRSPEQIRSFLSRINSHDEHHQ